MPDDKVYITPRFVSEAVTFERQDKSWLYAPRTSMRTMAEKQAEGVAYLWNTLQEYQIALLADEVGMGKTLQALAVCCLFWLKNHDARILIIAPRDAVARNWENEYSVFIDSHYKRADDVVKTSIGGMHVYEPILCQDLYVLRDMVRAGAGRLYISKTTSFSYLKTANNQNKADAAYAEAKKLNKEILEDIERPFDLLVIDEAHYFRNLNGNSQRVKAAQGLLSGFADNVLLLTATPNHSDLSDISNIVSYFKYLSNGGTNSIFEKKPEQILKSIALRRFRVLSRQNPSVKYQYRQEEAPCASFGEDENAELFFACYQKKLVDYAVKKQNKQHAGNKAADALRGRLMYGYLEGFEFIPQKTENKSSTAENDAENEDDNQGTDGVQPDDFVKSVDSEILIPLAQKYRSIMQADPPHPKYDELIKILEPNPLSYWKECKEKDVVFIRRIPSGYEIVRKLIDKYDQLMAEKIVGAAGGDQQQWRSVLDRAQFDSVMQNITKQGLTDETMAEADEENALETVDTQGIPYSRVLDLFRTKKNESPTDTDASRFRKRFTRDQSIFSLFFHPGIESPDFANTGLMSPVRFSTRYGKRKDKDLVIDYTVSAGAARMEHYPSDNDIKRLQKELYNKEGYEFHNDSELAIETIWTMFFSALADENDQEREEIIKHWSEFYLHDPFMREALCAWMKKGILFASPGLIDLYAAFLKALNRSNEKQEGYSLYQAFVNEVKELISESILMPLMKDAILHFKIFIEKIQHMRDRIGLVREKWDLFNNAQPAYPYTGNTKNERVLKAFNSPFFPDILVATSVLQEGVNLQYFCKRVHHYGIAWTPGDNEQRIGRIDRIMGLLEKKLDCGEEARLHIYYPYLSGTLDENQLASFLKRKVTNEKALDNCSNVISEKTISIEDLHINRLLSSPTQSQTEFKEPYYFPEVYEKEVVANPSTLVSENISSSEIIEYLYGLIVSCKRLQDANIHVTQRYSGNEYSDRIFSLGSEDSNNANTIFDVRARFDRELSAMIDGTVYALCVESPQIDLITEKKEDLNNNVYVGDVYKELWDLFPLVQPVTESSDERKIIKVILRSEIPFFAHKKKHLNLQAEEFEMAVCTLINAYSWLRHKKERATYKWSPPFPDNAEGIQEQLNDISSVWDIDTNKKVASLKKSIEHTWTGYIELLKRNHTYPFISFLPNGGSGQSTLRLSYPAISFEKEEQELLESWVNHVVSVENVRKKNVDDCESFHEYEEYEVLRAFRQCIRRYPDGIEKINFLRNVASYMKVGRLSDKRRRSLEGFFPCACRRQIVWVSGDWVEPRNVTIEQYDRDFLIDTTRSCIGTGWTAREDAMQLVKERLGFARVRQSFRTVIKSIFNSMIRRGVIESSEGYIKRL